MINLVFVFRDSILEKRGENCIGNIFPWQGIKQLTEKKLVESGVLFDRGTYKLQASKSEACPYIIKLLE